MRPHEDNKSAPIFIFALAVWVALIGIKYAILFYRPVYYWDGWTFFQSYVAWREGKMSLFSYLHASHNEHRMAIFRVLFAIDVKFGHARGILLMVLSILSLFGAGFIAAWSTLRSFDRPMRFSIAMLSGAAMINVSTIFNTAITTQTPLGLGLLIPVIFIITAFKDGRGYAVATFILGLLCTETVGSGVLAPISAAIVSIIFVKDYRRGMFLSVVAIAAICLFITPTPEDLQTGNVSKFTLYAVAYFLAAVGSPFEFFDLDHSGYGSVLVGAVLAMGAIALAAKYLLRRTSPREGVTVALSILTFTGASMAAMAVSRAAPDFPLASAMSSRYTTTAILFSIALSFVGYLSVVENRRGTIVRFLSLSLLVGVVIFPLRNELVLDEQKRILAGTDVALAAMRMHKGTDEAYANLYPAPALIRPLIDLMDRESWGPFAARIRPEDFDDKQYLINWPDVKALGNSREVALNHYYAFGFAEGRSDKKPWLQR